MLRGRLRWHTPDILAEELMGIAILLGARRQRVERQALPFALLDVERRLLGTVRYVGGLARGYYRPGERGVRAPLRRIVQDIRHTTGIDCSLESSGALAALQPAVARVVLDIAQEAIANAVRHAQCDRIAVRCTSIPGSLWLEVADNGRGCRQADLEHFGTSGVAWMHLRAQDCGGTLRISTRDQGGVLVRFELGGGQVS